MEYASKLNNLPTLTCEDAGPEADYNHIGGAACEQCSKEKVMEQEIVVHHGAIAPGNQVSSELGGVVYFNIEAAVLADDVFLSTVA